MNKNLYVFPYEEIFLKEKKSVVFRRKSFCEKHWDIQKIKNYYTYNCYYATWKVPTLNNEIYESLDLAKKALDQYLERCGFIFIPEDKKDMFGLLG